MAFKLQYIPEWNHALTHGIGEGRYLMKDSGNPDPTKYLVINPKDKADVELVSLVTISSDDASMPSVAGELKFSRVVRLNSGCGYAFVSVHNPKLEFYMNGTEFEENIPHMVNGVITGKFCFIKRGPSVSIRRIP